MYWKEFRNMSKIVDMKKIQVFLGTIIFCWCSSLVTYGGTVNVLKEKDTSSIVMENETWRLTIQPDNGGRVLNMVFKESGNDWGCPDGGLLLDHVTQQTWPGELMEAKYACKVLKEGGSEVSVELSCSIEGKYISRGQKGPPNPSISGLEVKKIITLRDGDRRIEVKYIFSNPTGEMKFPVPWIQNILHIGGDKENDHYYRPAPQGVQHDWCEWINNVKKFNGDDFLRRPMRGWSAWIDHNKKEGCVFLMDYNDLFWLYNCMGSSTLEWWYDPVTLEPGKSWETTVWVAPFRNLAEVSHGDTAIISDLDLKVEKAELSMEFSILSSSGSPLKDAVANLTAVSYPAGQELWKDTVNLGTVGADVVTKKLKGPKLNPPNQEVTVKADISSGNYKGTFERHIDPDEALKKQFAQPMSSYRMPPLKKVKHFVIPEGLKVERHDSPHVLIFRGMYYPYWRLDETLGEMGVKDIKVSNHTIFVYGDQLDWRPAQLSDLMAYDLVVIANVPPVSFTDVGQEMLKIYVEKGGSLLIFGGTSSFGHGEYAESGLQEWLPVKCKEKFDLVWEPRGVYLTPVDIKGCPVLTKPRPDEDSPAVFWYHRFEKTDGNVILKAGESPMVIVKEMGKGRIAVFGFTPCGDPPIGVTGFWDHPLYRKWLGEITEWLTMKKEVVQ